ncbi:hypothetical protein Hte_008271 [Hypoxylon texense]
MVTIFKVDFKPFRRLKGGSGSTKSSKPSEVTKSTASDATHADASHEASSLQLSSLINELNDEKKLRTKVENELLQLKNKLKNVQSTLSRTAIQLDKIQSQTREFNQVTDEELKGMATQLQYNVRNFAIQYFSEPPSPDQFKPKGTRGAQSQTTQPEAIRKLHTWRARTAKLVFEYPSDNDEAWNLGSKENIINEIQLVLSSLSKETYDGELHSVLGHAIDMDRVISSQVAKISWRLPNEVHGEASEGMPGQELSAVTCPDMIKRGKSNGEDFGLEYVLLSGK